LNIGAQRVDGSRRDDLGLWSNNVRECCLAIEMEYMYFGAELPVNSSIKELGKCEHFRNI
jgi:hypothetical protein